MRTVLVILLLWAAHSAVYHKITSLQPSPLTPHDYLTSTLGNFRLTLKAPTCQLQIETFFQPSYSIVGYYPRTALQPCSSLSVVNNSLLSDNGQPLLSLKNRQLASRFDQVFVTIDQTSIIRISGIYLNQYHTSQNWISIFRYPQQYTYAISNLSVTLYNSLSFIQNSGNWGFSATNGQLRIFKVENASKIRRYNYTSFTMTPSNLFDSMSNSLPYADYKGFQYEPKCLNTHNFRFQGPFTFSINPFFPQLRVLDQGGYEIISIRYPDSFCNGVVGVDYLTQTSKCISWFCPKNMFEHQGTCVTSCPAPYFHQIGSNNINRCVLVCRADYQKDQTLRICSCTTFSAFSCPSGLTSTVLGCLCSNGTFFNSINQVPHQNKSCLTTCGPQMFNHPDGICIPCPLNCQKCILSGNSYNYLKCLTCQLEFTINNDGNCIKQCNSSIGKIQQNHICQFCSVFKCKNCSQGINLCSSCQYPYSLLNNSCVVNCPQGYRSVFQKDRTFLCKINQNCPAQIVPTQAFNNQSQCLCILNNKVTFESGCGKQPPSCQFSQYYDSSTQQCLFCPIGCLTCALDGNNKVQCTSCRPDYTLFVTLGKNHYCQRISILSYCSSNYSQPMQICQVNNIQSRINVLPNRNLCLRLHSDCLICITDSNNACSYCKEGFYLFKGSCHATCPNGTSPYQFQRVCVEQSIPNCFKQVTKKSYWEFTKNTQNQNSDGFFNFITVNFQVTDPLNDPKGSAFVYSQRGSTPTYLDPRPINIAYSYQRCEICNPGFGLTKDGGCLPCTSPCLECIYAGMSQNSCLKCDSFHRLVNSSCIKLHPTQMPCFEGQYRNESYICQKKCLQFYRSDYQVVSNGVSFQVNCTYNCPSGHRISTVYHNGSSVLRCQVSTESQQDIIQLFGSRVQLFKGVMYLFTSSKRLNFSSDNIGRATTLSTQRRFLQATTTQTSSSNITKTDFAFIVIDNSSQTSNKGVLLQLNPANIEAQGPTYFGNSKYGINEGTKSPIDVIYDQTYGLFRYGRAMVFLLLFATVVFMGQHLTYKTDNLFITFGVIYLALPTLNLSPSASAFSSYSFLYGFAWSTYLQMFSNPRSLSSSVSWFDNYLQQPNNNAHYVLFVDNNVIRNGWSIILFLIAIAIIMFLIYAVLRCATVKKLPLYYRNRPSCLQNLRLKWSKKGWHQDDSNHSRSVGYLLMFFIQNSFLGLVYYSVMNLFNPTWESTERSTQIIFKALSAIFIVFIGGYIIVKWCINPIGGIYCFKRFLLGIILAFVSFLGGIDQNLPLTVVLLAASQILFIFLRYKYELLTNFCTLLCCKKQQKKQNRRVPIRNNASQRLMRIQSDVNSHSQFIPEEQNTEKRKFVQILVEQILIIVLYVFLTLINYLNEISVAVVWLILLFFLVNVGIDFFDLLTIFRQNYAPKGKKENTKPYIKEIRNNWDYDQSLKSLVQTTTE